MPGCHRSGLARHFLCAAGTACAAAIRSSYWVISSGLACWQTVSLGCLVDDVLGNAWSCRTWSRTGSPCPGRPARRRRPTTAPPGRPESRKGRPRRRRRPRTRPVVDHGLRRWLSASSWPTWVKPPATSASAISWVRCRVPVPLATVTGCSALSYGAAVAVGLGVALGVGLAEGLGVADGVAFAVRVRQVDVLTQCCEQLTGGRRGIRAGWDRWRQELSASPQRRPCRRRSS